MRIVHKCVRLRLIIQIAGLVDAGHLVEDGRDVSVSNLMKFEVEWWVMIFLLFREIEEGVRESHGSGSFFA